ncbi:MAG: S41 family peptidase [Acidiphilium sp.]
MTRWLRLLAVLLILPVAQAQAQTTTQGANARFNSDQAAQIWGAALTFMAPRLLKPVPISQLAVWGLSGLTALDPNLTVQALQGKIVLYGPDRVIYAIPAPGGGPDAGPQWGQTCAAVAAQAFKASRRLRRAGTGAVIRSFFDELFNHFDPYSRYESPREQDATPGPAGLGLTLSRDDAPDDAAIIAAKVAASGPAGQAGIQPGMAVMAVDGDKITNQHVAAVQAMLSGPVGSMVTLVVRPPHSLPQTISLTRAVVPPPTVFSKMRDGVGVIRVTAFGPNTGQEFATALAGLVGQSPQPAGIVIDLRGNRGGVLRQSVLSIDTLLSHGEIVQTIGRAAGANKIFHAEGGDLAQGLPVVILVDGQTASAAEVFTASLSDNDRAVVVGSATLGKGLVQTVAHLPGGGTLYVTWSRIIAPRGWPLQGLGVIPQVCTSLGTEAVRRQMQALRDGRDLMDPSIAAARNARPPLALAQILEIRDACPATIGANDDFKVARSLIAHPARYHAALIRPLRAG